MARAASASAGPRRAAWLSRLAEAALARGEWMAARAAREAALEAVPGDLALREQHLAELGASGDPAALVSGLDAALRAALAVLDEGNAASPGASAALEAGVGRLRVWKARTLLALGDAAGSAEELERAARVTPLATGWTEAAAQVRRLLQARGDHAAEARLELARGRATSGATKAAALLDSASLFDRAGQPERAREAAEEAREADPDRPAPWRLLAQLAHQRGEPVEAAQLLLAATLRCDGSEAALAASQAAELFELLGKPAEALRAWQAAAAAVPGWPSARRALCESARRAGDPQGAAHHLLALDWGALPQEEQWSHARELAAALQAAGDPRCEAAWEGIFHADASDAEAFDMLAALARERGESGRWLALAAEHEGALSAGGDPVRRRDLRCARAELFAELGQLGAAEGAWRAALAIDPHHRKALRFLRGLLAQRGDVHGAVQLLAREAAAWDDPERAAELLLDGLRSPAASDPELGTALEEVAARLRDVGSPRGRGLLARLGEARGALAEAARWPASRPVRASPPSPGADRFEEVLAEVRARPSDRATLERLVEMARTPPSQGGSPASQEREELRRAVLGELAAGALAFLDGAEGPRRAGPPRMLPEEARHRAAHPVALGATARLLGQLAPWLERLFRADMEARGAHPDDRLSPWHGPRIEAELEEVRRALGAPRLTGYLTGRSGFEVALENSQPVAVVMASGLAALPLAERRFLLARAAALAGLGASLPLKFAPRDLAILAELACRFAGATPPTNLLPEERMALYLEALQRAAPPDERSRAAELGPRAALELASLEPRALALGLRLTATRLAFLHGGDLTAALTALRVSERRLRRLTPAEVLADLELQDLLGFAFSHEGSSIVGTR